MLPASREQINKLGKRLAADGPITDEDLEALEELIACHMTALELARPRLDGLSEEVGAGPFHVTHRAKTTQTIIEKLRRETGMNLARVQDLAGIRVVGAMSLATQDQVVAGVIRRFPADPKDPRVVDRRADTSHGYRAVHVIVSLDEVSIEVQVRTLVQHIWADVMERLADRLGRQIRYGGAPIPSSGMTQETADGIVRAMMGVSANFASGEATEDPVYVAGAELHVERVTNEVWTHISAALSNGGIDL